MRVQVNRPNRGDERGAVAVMVALLVVAMIGFLAFVTDFGYAYANKRSIQNGVDAAALTYAQELHLATPDPTNCLDMADDPSIVSAAKAKATQIFRQNAPDPLEGPIQLEFFAPSCLEPGLTDNLVVKVKAKRSSPALIGRALRPNDLYIQAAARAIVGPAKTLTGVRPFALCDQLADLMSISPGSPLTIFFDNNTTPCGGAPGNFGTIDLRNPPPPGGPGGVVEAWTRYGYEGTVPADIPSTFEGDPGEPSANMRDDFRAILGESIVIPVYTSLTSSGSHSTYSVDRYIGVKVCGFRLVNNDAIDSLDCFVPTTATADPTKRFVQLAFDNFVSVADINTTCRIADTCDRGPLTVKLAD